MDLILFNRDEEREQIIDYLDYALSEEINGLGTLVFTCTAEDVHTYAKFKRVVFKDELGKWHEYIIQRAEYVREEDKELQVYCENSIIELLGEFIEDKRPYNVTPAAALNSALSETRWTAGTCEGTELKSTNFYRISAYEALGKIIETWGLELETEIIISETKIANRKIHLFNCIGSDNGRRFEWSKDLKGIKKTILDEPIYTALYGYGKSEEIGEGYGRRISFAEINNGKAFVENEQSKMKYGIPNMNGTYRNIFGKLECDAETPEELLELTEKELQKVSIEKVKYEAKVLNLAQYGFEHEGVKIGDEVTIIDDEIGTIKARVVKMIKRPNNQETEIIIGNYRDAFSQMQTNIEETLENFRSRASVWDRANAFDKDGYLKDGFLRSVLDVFNAELNTAGGYVYAEEGEGITTYNRPKEDEPTQATQLLSAGLRIANQKLSDGSWDWKTAITSLGIVADVIYTGRIIGQTSYYDLDQGVLEFITEINGKSVRVKLSVSNGFEIFENDSLIGGLGVIDGKVCLNANSLSNDPEDSWASLGTVTYQHLGESRTTAGIKIGYQSDGEWNYYAIAKDPSNDGIVIVHNGILLASLNVEDFTIISRKIYEEQGKLLVTLIRSYWDRLEIKCEKRELETSTLEAAANIQMFSDGYLSIFSSDNFIISGKNGNIGTDENGVYAQAPGQTRKYLT